MANTTTAPHNKSVAFSGRTEREMSSWNNKGITHSGSGKNPPGLGKGVTSESDVKPPRMNAEAEPVEGFKPKNLPAKIRKTAKRAMKRGMISAKAAKTHLGDI